MLQALPRRWAMRRNPLVLFVLTISMLLTGLAVRATDEFVYDLRFVRALTRVELYEFAELQLKSSVGVLDTEPLPEVFGAGLKNP